MKTKFFLSLLVVLLLGGCFAKMPDTRYYLLDYVPSPSPERLAKGPYPLSLRMKEFTVAEAYRRDQIVYRQSAHELRFYNFELWAVKPERLVGDMVFRHLNEARLFREVTRNIDQEESNLVLKGEITALEEYDNEDSWFAHLAMTLTLQDPSSQNVVWSRAFDYRKRVERQEPVYVVRELSFLLELVMEETVADLDKVLAGYGSQQNLPVSLDKQEQQQQPEKESGSVELPLPPADTALAPPEGAR